MQIKLINIPKLSPTFGYILISIFAAGIVYPLVYDDWHTIIFALILFAGFLIGVSMDTSGKPADSDLASIGWSDIKNSFQIYIPLSIAIGLLAIFIGGLIMEFFPQKLVLSSASITQQNMVLLSAAIVPDYSGIKLAGVSVIPMWAAASANIIAQFFVIAPAEEVLSKSFLPYGGMSIFKNIGLAYLFGLIGWVFLHIPTLLAQNASSAMYLVLLVLGGFTLLIYSFTKSLFSAILIHATFNTGVILMGAGTDPVVYYVLLIIIAILAFIWLQPKRGKK